MLLGTMNGHDICTMTTAMQHAGQCWVWGLMEKPAPSLEEGHIALLALYG
jgi:hypothetical protein